jgi:hypothetical protein
MTELVVVFPLLRKKTQLWYDEDFLEADLKSYEQKPTIFIDNG